MGIPIRVTSRKDFSLTCYEDRGCEGRKWIVTRTSIPEIPNDEVAAFILDGKPNLKIEFFNDSKMSKRKSWAEVQLKGAETHIRVDNMRFSQGPYLHHKVGTDDNIDGKVSAIRIVDTGIYPND